MSSLTKETKRLEEAADFLLKAARKAGADTAEVCAVYSSKNRIALEKQDFHLTSSDEGVSLGLRVLRNKRQGFSSCNTTDVSDLAQVASKAVEIAAFSPENPHDNMQGAPEIPKEAPKASFDETLCTLPLQKQKDWTILLRDEALKDSRFRINDGAVEVSFAVSLISNSLGVHKIEEDTIASWSLMGMGVEGTNITSFDYFQAISRDHKEVPKKLAKTVSDFTKLVLGNLKVGNAKSYKGPVLLTPRAVIDILLEGLSYHLNGRILAENIGKWKFQELGKEVLHPSITIKDIPWATDRTGFTLFDREGTPTKNRDLITAGVLKGFLLDHYSAHALKSQSTGNAAGGTTSVPSVSSHCLALLGGKTSLVELQKEASAKTKEYLKVHRFSGQVDPVTGEFSGVAKGGEWCQNQESLYFVKETLISGNIFEALGSALLGLSKEVEVVQDGEESPYFLIDNVSVTSHAS